MKDLQAQLRLLSKAWQPGMQLKDRDQTIVNADPQFHPIPNNFVNNEYDGHDEDKGKKTKKKLIS